MELDKLDKSALDGLSQEALVDIVLRLQSQVEQKTIQVENECAKRKELAEVLRAIAENFELMRLQGKQYYVSESDPIAVDINAGIARITAKAISLVNQINGLLHGMKPGSEKSKPKGGPGKRKVGKTEKSDKDNADDADTPDTKKPDNPNEYLRVAIAVQNALDKLSEGGAPVDWIHEILIANTPSRARLNRTKPIIKAAGPTWELFPKGRPNGRKCPIGSSARTA